MKKTLLILSLCLALGTVGMAQDYTTGVGVRAGLGQGLTVKHFLGEKTAVEGIAVRRYQGFLVTGLYEIHSPAFDVSRLHWYYGVGGHVGFWDPDNTPFTGDSSTVIGVDLVLGIEYNIEELPINVGIDWKPAFNLVGYTGWWGDNGAFSVRFIF